MRIAGSRTVADWAALRAQLQTIPTPPLWDTAYKEFYRARINSRYLGPMSSIQAHGSQKGEGFAIVSLFCTLVEFLETCEKGINFRLAAKAALLPYEYGQKDAAVHFKAFFRTRVPFNTVVPNRLVDSFYGDVRCGLLHEARTKGHWEISSRKSPGRLVAETGGTITLFRTELVPSLETYFADYRARLGADGQTQGAFIRKFDDLCQP